MPHTRTRSELIAGALLRGWTVAHVGKTMKAYMMPPSKFREIVAIAYEAIDAPRDFEPERALRAYRALQKKEAADRAVVRKAIREAREAGG